MIYFSYPNASLTLLCDRSEVCLMVDPTPLTNQNPSIEENAPAEAEGTDIPVEGDLLETTEDDLLEEELEELVIEDFTIDGICGVY
jgi:mycofactocin precursor